MPRSSRHELEIIGSVAEALNSAPSIEEALDRTLELVTDLLGLQTGWVWLVDPETGHIYRAAPRNLPPYLQEPARMSGESLCLSIREFPDGTPAARNIDIIQCSRRAPLVRRKELSRN